MSGKVILVEDDTNLRNSLINCLDAVGLDVTGVGTAVDFYKKIDREDYAVAVVDIGLPDQSGFVLSQYIRDNTSMGIIILTARDSLNDWVQGYEAGADQYLVKPIRCKVLAAAVKSLMDRTTRPPATTSQQWILDTTGTALTLPSGEKIGLTHMELTFLSLLLKQPDFLAERELLLEGLGYQNDEYGGRALSSLVLRLRKKIKAAGVEESPIKTAYTVGFRFSEQALVR